MIFRPHSGSATSFFNGKKNFLLCKDVNQTSRDNKIIELVDGIFEALPTDSMAQLPADDLYKMAHELKNMDKGHTIMPHIHHQFARKLADVMVGDNACIYKLSDGRPPSSIVARDFIVDVFHEWATTTPMSIGHFGHEKIGLMVRQSRIARDMAHGGLGAVSYEAQYNKPTMK